MWLRWWEEGKAVLTLFLLGLIRYFHKCLAAVQQQRIREKKKLKKKPRGKNAVWCLAITDVLTQSQNTLETNHKTQTTNKNIWSQGCEQIQSRSSLAASAGAQKCSAYSLRCEQRPFQQSHIQRFIEDILLGVVQNEPCPQSSSNFTLAE